MDLASCDAREVRRTDQAMEGLNESGETPVKLGGKPTLIQNSSR